MSPQAVKDAAITKDIADHLADKVLTNLAKQEDVNLTVAGKNDIKAQVVKETTEVIMNQTNQEPWYQSTILVTQYVTLLVTILGLLGYVIEPELQKEIIGIVLALGAVITPLITIYARLFKKKPLTILGTGTGKG